MKKVKAKDLDTAFDRGEDMTQYLNKSKSGRVNAAPKRFNFYFPAWIMASLDKEAPRLGITRQSLAKIRITKKFKQEDHVS